MSRVTSIPAGPTAHETLVIRGAELQPSTPLERAELLDETEWGRRYSWEQIRLMSSYLRRYQLDAGLTLFREGDHDAFLAIVVNGQLEIHKHDQTEHDQRVALVGRGKLVGEMSLLDGAARSATAIAGTPTELLVLTKDDFHRLAADLPATALTLTLVIATTIAQLLRQTTGALVDHLGA